MYNKSFPSPHQFIMLNILIYLHMCNICFNNTIPGVLTSIEQLRTVRKVKQYQRIGLPRLGCYKHLCRLKTAALDEAHLEDIFHLPDGCFLQVQVGWGVDRVGFCLLIYRVFEVSPNSSTIHGATVVRGSVEQTHKFANFRLTIKDKQEAQAK